VAGAYWHVTAPNPCSSGYTASLPDAPELESYKHRLAEAAKRDHKKLGPELGLFMFHPTAPACPTGYKWRRDLRCPDPVLAQDMPLTVPGDFLPTGQ